MASTGGLINPFQYTGREFDQETGLYYYRARYFDPSTGHFLSEDPIEFDGGINFYTYVENSPTNFFDPLGLQSTTTGPPATQPYPGDPSAAEVDEAIGTQEATEAAEASEAGPVGLVILDGVLGYQDYKQFRKLCEASGWSWCSRTPTPNIQCTTDHKQNRTKRNRPKHQEGKSRKKRDRRGVSHRQYPPRKPPDKWKGKWPPDPGTPWW